MFLSKLKDGKSVFGVPLHGRVGLAERDRGLLDIGRHLGLATPYVSLVD